MPRACNASIAAQASGRSRSLMRKAAIGPRRRPAARRRRTRAPAACRPGRNRCGRGATRARRSSRSRPAPACVVTSLDGGGVDAGIRGGDGARDRMTALARERRGQAQRRRHAIRHRMSARRPATAWLRSACPSCRTTHACIRPAPGCASGFTTSTPRRARAPSARVSAAGTASANAQGQEITSTAIAAGKARDGSTIAHTAAVSAVNVSTRATKRPAASLAGHLQPRTFRMRAADERGDSRERGVRADALDAQRAPDHPRARCPR